jgi:hypothetical protein
VNIQTHRDNKTPNGIGFAIHILFQEETSQAHVTQELKLEFNILFKPT